MNKSVTPNDLRTLIEDYITAYPQKAGERNIWRKPILATAKADDRFDILPQIAAEDHALPQDLLPSAKSVVVFFVPFVKELTVENHKGEIPCRNWGLAYESTNLENLGVRPTQLTIKQPSFQKFRPDCDLFQNLQNLHEC